LIKKSKLLKIKIVFNLKMTILENFKIWV
jgi:hypothetical protein